MASSSLMKSIDSIFIRMEDDSVFDDRSWQNEDELKIGLRNLRLLLLVSRDVMGSLMQSSSSTLASTFSRIETELDLLLHSKEIHALSMAMFVHRLGTSLDWQLWSNGIYHSPSHLTVDEVVGITDSVLENATNFLSFIHETRFQWQTNAFEAMDAFQVHMRFMKNVLLLAGRGGLESLTVLMSRIQPVANQAALVFIKNQRHNDEQWCSEIRSRCLKVNRMATDPQLYQAYSHALATAKLSSSSLHTDYQALENLLDSLISLLWDALRHASDSAIKDDFKLLYQRLRFSRGIFKQRGGVTTLGEAISGQVLVLICEAGVLVCSFHQAADPPGRLSDLLQRFDVFRSQLVALEASPSMQENDHDELGFGDYSTIDISDGHEKVPQVLGFQGDEVATVLDLLTRGSKQLRIVPICGMAGLGKTTFALKLYNHPSVLHHFWAHAWCPISQELDKNKVLLQLLNQIQPGVDHSCLSEEDLGNKLRQNLKGRRYLILLDDVWSPEVLNTLNASFPDDSTGSRIVLTSRRVDIATHHLLAQHPYLLRLRADNECIEILQTKLFHKDGWSNDLGVEVAKICKGLPLTLVLISGLLAATEQQSWKEVLDHFSSSNSVSGAEQCNIALELGYKHLPDYLQPCFLYFGAFPEDKEVSVKTVIQLWMAEGFVIKDELKRIEDVGREYMEKLIERSLVIVGEKRSIGGAKTCRIHDLLHGFCQRIAKQNNLLHLLLPTHDQLLDFNEPCNLLRFSIHSTPVDFKRLRLFYPGALSLLFFRRGSHLFDMSFIIQIFQLLKVLHMDEIVLISGIPNEIGLLTRLTYLSYFTSTPIIPSSVGNLTNLETFIPKIPSFGVIPFPNTLWNLQKLRYLHMYGGFTLPVENLENSSSLLELETLRGVIFYSDSSMEKQLQKFPRIRRLKCRIRLVQESTEEGFCNIVVPDLPTQLRSISMHVNDKFVRCEFGSTAENLSKLNLDGFVLSKEYIAVIGKFPSLEILKLANIHFPDHVLEMEEEEFPKLRFFRLYSSGSLERWTTCDDELPSLQKLELWNCEYLEEIPSWLETSSMLEEIQVLRCSSALESLVRDIEQVQKDYGNLVKVRITSK